ncbi:MAG: D-amino acid dehydrogenase [Betaproteobacteria bacterium]|nr:D-amino acid dehydrogenase [Betaproteobacteria bacterium]
MKILILGAGVIGATTAWQLRQRGHEVEVVDRCEAAGLETSFANGGQISVSHAEPWATPHAIPQALLWLGREDAPLLFHLRPFDRELLAWSLAFMGNCLPYRVHANIRAIVNLALYSRERLQALRADFSHAEDKDFNLEYDGLQKGILHFYTNRKAFTRALAAARLMRDFGLSREPVDAETCIRIEPALAGAKSVIVGGDYTATDESGDAYLFTQAIARRAAAAGVVFHYKRTVTALDIENGRVRGARLADGTHLFADACVLALGSFSTPFLRPYGVRLPVYPAKGYSVTLPLAEGADAPSVSLTDDEHKLVFSRLGNRLRIAGTAEFNGYNLDLNSARCHAILTRVRQLFPTLLQTPDAVEGATFWCGLRPSTPSNVPLLGKSALPGLWLNTGHGTLGWTLACGSAAAIADLMEGRKPGAYFPFQTAGWR